MKKALLFTFCLLALVVVVALFNLGADKETPTATPVENTTAAAQAALPASIATSHSVAASSHPVFHTGLEHLPFSLQGSQVDGQFETDADGHLKVTSGIHHIFDYFLSTLGEEPLATVTARLQAYINNQLQPPASGEAQQLLQQYLDYKQALTQVEGGQDAASSQGDDINTLRNRLAQRQALRTQYLGAQTADTFFGAQTAYDHYTLDRLQVMQNDTLSAPAKAQALANLQQQLPASLREENDAVSQYQALAQVQKECAKAQCSTAELHQARANLVGEAAADRLDQLDQQHSAWQQQLKQWLTQRDAILHNTNLSLSDQQAQITQLRAQQFSGGELVRIQALETSHDKSAAQPSTHTP